MVHFYQYIVDNMNEAKRVLIWAAKLRLIPERSSKFDKLDDDNEDFDYDDQGTFAH